MYVIRVALSRNLNTHLNMRDSHAAESLHEPPAPQTVPAAVAAAEEVAAAAVAEGGRVP